MKTLRICWSSLLFAGMTWPQQYLISTVAGGLRRLGMAAPLRTLLCTARARWRLMAWAASFIADTGNNAVRRLQPTSKPTLVCAVADAASESPLPVSPGKIVVIYGTGPGPSSISVAAPAGGVFGTQPAGTTVSFNRFAGAVPGAVAGLMQVDVLIPDGIQPGRRVPVILRVGTALNNKNRRAAASLVCGPRRMQRYRNTSNQSGERGAQATFLSGGSRPFRFLNPNCNTLAGMLGEASFFTDPPKYSSSGKRAWGFNSRKVRPSFSSIV